MSFANALKRLDAVIMNRQPGEQAETCRVRRQDLRELLHHFRRLDAEVREHHANPSPQPREGLSDA
jgi:transposase